MPRHNEWHTVPGRSLHLDGHGEVAFRPDDPALGGRVMLVETGLPVRWYLPREDVRLDLLTPSHTHTVCAYKGVASYLSAEGAPDVAWFYPDPLHDALPVKDMVCFWRDAVVTVDGQRVDTSIPGEP